MKRIYACIAIVAALLGLSYYSSFQVRRFADEMGSGLDSAIQAVYQADYPTAQQVILSGADRCDEMREGMNHLLRTQDFTELEAALRAAGGFLALDAPEEALGELRRAQVQVENMEWMSRRWV